MGRNGATNNYKKGRHSLLSTIIVVLLSLHIFNNIDNKTMRTMAFTNTVGFVSRLPSRSGTTQNPFSRCQHHSRPRQHPFIRAMISSKSSPAISRSNSTPSFSTSKEQNHVDECPLPYETLPYRGAEVRLSKSSNPGNKKEEDETFLNKLKSALDYWTRNDYTSAWIHVHSSRASLVETLTATPYSDHELNSIKNNESSVDTIDGLGFDLHHVNTTQNTIILKKWLRKGAEDKIPPFATHQVGCAGFVLSDDNEILVIQEWTGPLSNRTPSTQWKLPGGLLDAGESFAEGTCREVVEETGVTCDFESLLAFWHRHGLVFGKSDFYFVCLLKPKGKDIVIDPVEVSAAKWMHIDEFLETQDHPLIHHVLRNAFQIGVGENVGAKSNGGRIQPVNEMVEGFVQWPNRSPFPTYTGNSKNFLFEEEIEKE